MTILQYPMLIRSNGVSKKEYIEVLYHYYVNNIEYHKDTLLGRSVSFRRNQIKDGRNGMFWHLVTKNESTNYDDVIYCRGERIPYITYMVNNCERDKNEIHYYYETDVTGTRLIVLCFNALHRYQCVFEETATGFQLITAYPPKVSRWEQKKENYIKYWESK